MKPELNEIKGYDNYDIIPVYEEFLSDSTTPLNVLRNIKEVSERFYLLESVDQSKFSRYSYLGYNPVHNISCKDNMVKIDDNEPFYSKNPIDEVGKILKNYRAPRIEGLPIFCGGFVGYFSYDSYKYLEPKLVFKSKDDAKFNDFELSLFDKVIAFDSFKQKVLIICNIHLNNLEAEYEQAKNDIEEIKELIFKAPNKTVEKNVILKKPTSIDSKEEYEKKLERVKKHIYDGDIFQCVFSRRFKGEMEGSLFEAYRNLRSINPSPYMYYLKSHEVEIAGASPETLCSKHGDTVTTYPIAGTRPRGKTIEDDIRIEQELMADEKELAEHNMLVDLGRNDVGRVCQFGTVSVPEYMKILRFSHVMHIASTVVGKSKPGYTSLEALQSILPAGTLSGAPKLRACQIIDDLEVERRGIYGGALGYIDFTDNMDMCIVIRTIIKKNKTIYLQAGGGIVMDSVPENEYLETENKAMATFKAIEAVGGNK
ncbi:MAG: anthranilate synthase component I [Acholeplasmatales bacterium]|nr:anthranilate synthase component I [Acholeplasmatales bacterium]